MTDLARLEAAAALVHGVVPPTPQYCWPLLSRRVGAEIWVKHENHTPIGAFKVRGGLTYLDALRREQPRVRGIISATRGNHGQSLAFAGRHFGVPVAVVVPYGNATEKNAAMRALGAELIEHGADFDEAKQHAAALAAERGYAFVPSFDVRLVLGVATYARELFAAAGDLDVIYVPIGLGSGICGTIAARDALGRKARVIGVISDRANTYRLSLDAGRAVPTNSALTFADGMAVRVPDEEAMSVMQAGMERLVEVSDDEIAEAIRNLYTDTHTLAEGAGAAAFAALMRERDTMRGKRAAVIVSGQNIDRPWMQTLLAGGTPVVV